jgi:hypothetical protein
MRSTGRQRSYTLPPRDVQHEQEGTSHDGRTILRHVGRFKLSRSGRGWALDPASGPTRRIGQNLVSSPRVVSIHCRHRLSRSSEETWRSIHRSSLRPDRTSKCDAVFQETDFCSFCGTEWQPPQLDGVRLKKNPHPEIAKGAISGWGTSSTDPSTQAAALTSIERAA